MEDQSYIRLQITINAERILSAQRHEIAPVLHGYVADNAAACARRNFRLARALRHEVALPCEVAA